MNACVNVYELDSYKCSNSNLYLLFLVDKYKQYTLGHDQISISIYQKLRIKK